MAVDRKKRKKKKKKKTHETLFLVESSGRGLDFTGDPQKIDSSINITDKGPILSDKFGEHFFLENDAAHRQRKDHFRRWAFF